MVFLDITYNGVVSFRYMKGKRKVYKNLTKIREENELISVEKRLNHEEKLQVIQWCVELYSNQEIVKLIKEKKATKGKGK